VTSAIVTVAVNVALIALVYGALGLGLPSIIRWAARRLVGQLATSVLLLARAIPLLLLFSVVLFINTEMWQVFSDMPDGVLAALCGLLVLVGSMFLAARIPREVEALEIGGPALTRGQRVNVGTVMFVSHALQVLVVSISIGAFFAVFGALAIDTEVMKSWVGDAGDAVVAVDALGTRLRITEELLRVSAGIASLCGLYYSIAVLTDSTYREEFRTELEAELRDTFAARAEYVAVRAAER
jgi:hypothetical protein